MTGLYINSLQRRLQECRQDVAELSVSLRSLKNQDSEYALEHRALLSVLEAVLEIYEKAPREIKR